MMVSPAEPSVALLKKAGKISIWMEERQAGHRTSAGVLQNALVSVAWQVGQAAAPGFIAQLLRQLQTEVKPVERDEQHENPSDRPAFGVKLQVIQPWPAEKLPGRPQSEPEDADQAADEKERIEAKGLR
jgi:hypothetical protein